MKAGIALAGLSAAMDEDALFDRLKSEEAKKAGALHAAERLDQALVRKQAILDMLLVCSAAALLSIFCYLFIFESLRNTVILIAIASFIIASIQGAAILTRRLYSLIARSSITK